MSESVPLKKFVTESELDEKRKKRQEEWEKVRQPHQPIEAPEEHGDSRSLYEQLQAQKDQKQLEFDEQHRMRNQVRGIDKEEADFLEYVVERQQEIEKEKRVEENQVLQEFRNSVANHTVSAEQSAKSNDKPTNDKPTAPVTRKRSSQAELLAGVVKKKRSDSAEAESKQSSEQPASKKNTSDSSPEAITSTTDAVGVAKIVGVLPGLGCYTDSENSDTSSSDSEIDTDLFRRDHSGHKTGHDGHKNRSQ